MGATSISRTHYIRLLEEFGEVPHDVLSPAAARRHAATLADHRAKAGATGLRRAATAGGTPPVVADASEASDASGRPAGSAS